VTGGNGGIGKAIALALARAGCGLAIAARSPGKTEAARLDIQAECPVPVNGYQVDVRLEDQINTVTTQIVKDFGRIDILVNNAGINIRKLPQDLSEADWNEVLSVNLRSAFLCSKAVYPAMKRVGSGKIINIGSLASTMGGAKTAASGARKGGLVQVTRSLAVAWAPDRIQVNAILPGWIETDLTPESRIAIPGLDEKVLSRTPAGRWGAPDDVAGSAVFLASPASDFVTGVALPVDGGFSIMIG
jgi:2-deoxy-D-gluconate 3-dehydrogenase